MTQINLSQAFDARGWLVQAAESALIVCHVPENHERLHLDRMMRNVHAAALALGYRLVPLTQDKPDSGRASIPETEPEVGERMS